MTLPVPSSDIVIADFNTELVVLVPNTRRAHHLEPMWAVLFDSCRLGHSRSEVVSDLAEANGWSRPETEDWVRRALGELAGSGIVAPSKRASR